MAQQSSRPVSRPTTRPTATTARATSTRTRSTKATPTGKPRPFNMPFESKNINIVLIGIAVIALGYVVMGSGDALSGMSLNVSPWILVIGYLVIVPFGIMYGARRMKNVRATAAAESTTLVQE